MKTSNPLEWVYRTALPLIGAQNILATAHCSSFTSHHGEFEMAHPFRGRQSLEPHRFAVHLRRLGPVRLIVFLLQLFVHDPLRIFRPALDPAKTFGILWVRCDEEEATFRLRQNGVIGGLEQGEEVGVLFQRDVDFRGENPYNVFLDGDCTGSG